MNAGAPLSSESLPLSLQQRVDKACDRFEDAWRTGPRPRIEDYLADASEPERSNLLGELLALDIELRRDAGERPTPEEYRGRFPEHVEWISAAFQRQAELA